MEQAAESAMAKDDIEIDDWLDGGEPKRGRVVNKTELKRITGLADVSVDNAVRDGAPIESRGNKREGHRYNTAAFFDWYWRHKVEMNTDASGFDAAKLRDKEAQTRLRELQIAQKEGSLIPVEAVIEYNRRKYGVVRQRFLAVESQIVGLTPDQREQLQAALADAFADVSDQPMEDWFAGGPFGTDDSEVA